MPTVKLRFPGGRYHATPWGHHVNEGLIEWPPSPWRLLRAFIACGVSSQGWSDVPPAGRSLIDKLATVLPLYRLPAASAAHSRHYMPTIEGKAQKTTLVFDTWANVGDGELFIHWPCELDAEEFRLFSQLVSALGYLGRSESWVEAEVTNHTREWDSVPCQSGERRGYGWEQVSLMAAIPPNEYQKWRQEVTEPILEKIKLPRRGGKRGPSEKAIEKNQQEREKALDPFPPDLIACLIKDTAWWKGHGWSQPPGSRRVLYWRPSDALEVGVPPEPRQPSVHTVTTMLLALTTPSGNRSALPPITRTLPQAELFHRAIIGRLGHGRRVDCPELTGKDEFGRPLHDRHEHAHTIPVDLDGDDRLDHIMIYARMGLRDAAQRAIRTLRRTWTKGGVGELQLAVVGSGDLGMLRRLPAPLNLQLEAIFGSPEEVATLWESVTPFVPPRYLKAKGKDTLEGQVQAELRSRGLPAAEAIEIDPELTRSLRHFVRRRVHGGVPPKMDIGFGLRLRFAQPIPGPLLLGYASHYGLGLFRACAVEPLVITVSNCKEVTS